MIYRRRQLDRYMSKCNRTAGSLKSMVTVNQQQCFCHNVVRTAPCTRSTHVNFTSRKGDKKGELIVRKYAWMDSKKETTKKKKIEEEAKGKKELNQDFV